MMKRSSYILFTTFIKQKEKTKLVYHMILRIIVNTRKIKNKNKTQKVIVHEFRTIFHMSVTVQAFQWSERVLREAGKILDDDLSTVRVSSTDQLRLLSLKTWSLRYQVPLQFILEFFLVEYFHKVIEERQPHRLGIFIATFCGPKAQKALENHILECFPANENLSDYRNRLIDADMAITKFYLPRREIFTDDKITQSYGNWAQRQSKERERIARSLSRRPWRGNPFR